MSTLTIPTDNIPYSSQRTDLDGREYVLSFDYSSREECWYLTIADSEESPIATVKLICDFPLLYRVADERKPPGILFVASVTEDQSPPGLQDLGSGRRCELVYTVSTVTE